MQREQRNSVGDRRGMALKTRAQALRDLGLVVAEIAAETAHLTPREAAERAWEPSSPISVDELVDLIAAGRAWIGDPASAP